MARKSFKVGDTVEFTFLGEPLKGTVERIKKEKPMFSRYKLMYWIFDGKHRYPTAYENIKSKVK